MYTYGFQNLEHPTLQYNEYLVGDILEKALQDGLVTLYDAGRGHAFWFEGFPGKAMRALKKRIDQLITPVGNTNPYGF